MKKICLNMIVRNEEKILERSLRSAAPYISAYAILDTGSTDGTCDLIKRVMDEYGIPGVIGNDEFKSFSQARNSALDLCRKSSLDFTHILLFDADMELVVTDESVLDALDDRNGQVMQKNNSLEYWNTRIVSRSVDTKYVCPTHEYITSPNGNVNLSGLHFIDHACGSNRPEKFERDVRLLSEELKTNPNDERCLFYLARTYQDMGKTEEAIEYFQKRIDVGGWDEEIWYSRMMMADCYKRIGNMDKFVSTALKSFNDRPWRSEPIVMLAEHYSSLDQYDLAIYFAYKAIETPYPADDVLFIQSDCYDWRAKLVSSIMGFYSKIKEYRAISGGHCAELTIMDSKKINWIQNMSLRNYCFYGSSIVQKFGARLMRLPQISELPSGYNQSTPCIIKHPSESDKYLMSIRCVNYTINEWGGYEFEGPAVKTENYLVDAEIDENINYSNTRHISGVPVPNSGNIHGIEDIRLVSVNGEVWASASYESNNDSGRNISISRFKITESGNVTDFSRMYVDWNKHGTEKNWMPFEFQGKQCFMYSTSPSKWFSVEDDGNGESVAKDVVSTESPESAHRPWMRGGSQLINVGDKWIAVIHEVTTKSATEGSKRVYLHRFVQFDSEFKLVGASDPWWFGDAPQIEFCAGMSLSHSGEELIIPFSINDSSASIAIVPVDKVMSQIKPIN